MPAERGSILRGFELGDGLAESVAVRLELEGPAERANRLGPLAEPELALAQAPQGPEVVGVEVEDAATIRGALGQAARDEVGDRPLVVRLREALCLTSRPARRMASSCRPAWMSAWIASSSVLFSGVSARHQMAHNALTAIERVVGSLSLSRRDRGVAGVRPAHAQRQHRGAADADVIGERGPAEGALGVAELDVAAEGVEVVILEEPLEVPDEQRGGVGGHAGVSGAGRGHRAVGEAGGREGEQGGRRDQGGRDEAGRA